MGRRSARFGLLAVVMLTVVGGLGAYGLAGEDTVVYYRTPSELVDDPPDPEAPIRLGGMVVDGSIERDGELVRFVLTDGVAEVDVVHDGEVRGVFQEGQGALVEGRATDDGAFRSELVMVQHDNTYDAGDGDDREDRVEPGDGAGEAAP